ncbi:unnamed protein product, partial [Ectocarpus fasciculatus]
MELEQELYLAARDGDTARIRELLKQGANLHSRDPTQGQTAFTLMHAAASGGAEELIRFIHSIGVNVNCTDESGATPLFYAVDKGNDDAVDALLLLGADVNASRQDGSTPLIAAVQGKRASTVKLLCDRGADTCLANEESGLTALHAAASGNNSEIIKLL